MSNGPETTIDNLLDALTNAGETHQTTTLDALTVFDRCDAAGCSAQAYVRAQLRSGLQLVFCGHHGHALIAALAGQGAVIRDDSHVLVQDRSQSTNS
jgi:hypothetical protein